MDKEAFKEALDHAKRVFPRESCGLLVIEKGEEVYYPCRNISTEPSAFVLDPMSYQIAESRGEIIAVIHSHADGSLNLSEADSVSCETFGLPWYIVSAYSQTFSYFQPRDYVPPLVGRKFDYGKTDCFTLVRDYYQQNLKVTLKDFERTRQGDDFYIGKVEKWGFRELQDGEALKIHDVIIMQISTRAPAHGGIYIGSNYILHHLTGRLSSRDMYNDYYRKRTKIIARFVGVRGDGSANG